MSSSSSNGCSRMCLHLTNSEMQALISQGWRHIGDFSSEEECLINCCSSSSSSSNSTVFTPCCDSVPINWIGTISGSTIECVGMDGVTFTMNYAGITNLGYTWIGIIEGNPGYGTLTVYCNGEGWFWSGLCGSVSNQPVMSAQCNPFEIQLLGTFDTNCCNGSSGTITIVGA